MHTLGFTSDQAQPACKIHAAGFLTAAVRSWLVNHLLADEDLPELTYLLLELGYDAEIQIGTKDALKREMSRLAAGDDDQQLCLMRLCEGLIQFYLLRHGDAVPELEQLNRFLPPEWAFSPVTGRSAAKAETLSDPPPAADLPVAPIAAEAFTPVDAVLESADDSNETFEPVEPDRKPAERSGHFREIRQRRLQLLKEWENSSKSEVKT